MFNIVQDFSSLPKGLTHSDVCSQWSRLANSRTTPARFWIFASSSHAPRIKHTILPSSMTIFPRFWRKTNMPSIGLWNFNCVRWSPLRNMRKLSFKSSLGPCCTLRQADSRHDLGTIPVDHVMPMCLIIKFLHDQVVLQSFSWSFWLTQSQNVTNPGDRNPTRWKRNERSETERNQLDSLFMLTDFRIESKHSRIRCRSLMFKR